MPSAHATNPDSSIEIRRPVLLGNERSFVLDFRGATDTVSLTPLAQGRAVDLGIRLNQGADQLPFDRVAKLLFYVFRLRDEIIRRELGPNISTLRVCGVRFIPGQRKVRFSKRNTSPARNWGSSTSSGSVLPKTLHTGSHQNGAESRASANHPVNFVVHQFRETTLAASRIGVHPVSPLRTPGKSLLYCSSSLSRSDSMKYILKWETVRFVFSS